MDIPPRPSQVAAVFNGKTLDMDSLALDSLMNQVHRQAGTIAYTSEEYFASEHGAANSHVGLYEIVHHPVVSQAPCWWPDAPGFSSSPARPLAGLKVVDLTRVIAGPTITKSLAELGASVMRVTSPHIADFTSVFRDLNWGKWNCHLHLKDECDKEKLRDLIRDADVVVDGYRPGVSGHPIREQEEKIRSWKDTDLRLGRSWIASVLDVQTCSIWFGTGPEGLSTRARTVMDGMGRGRIEAAGRALVMR